MKYLLTTINTSFRHDDQPVITEEHVEEENNSIKKTVKTGYDIDKVISKKQSIPTISIDDITFEKSVKNTINTGFGSGTLHKECPTPKLVEYLNKSNYLSEFKTDIDKELARQNLEVYSSTQVNKLLEQITNSVGSIYVTKKEVMQIVDDLDFVDSTLKSYANYEIPSNLFRL